MTTTPKQPADDTNDELYSRMLKIDAAVASLFTVDPYYIDAAIDVIVEREPCALLMALTRKFLDQRNTIKDLRKRLHDNGIDDAPAAKHEPPSREPVKLLVVPAPR
jgi:hypothetical protein